MAEQPKPPTWEYKNRLAIHGRMAEVIKKTIEATKLELEAQRKKLRKLQYGK